MFKDEWVFVMSDNMRQQFYDNKFVETNISFFIALDKDPDLLLRTINISPKQLCLDKLKIPFETDAEKDINSIGIITDIASGLNFNRPGLNKIIKMALNKEVDEIIVTYKDRLARFGFELLENILKESSNGKITVLNNNDDSPEEELTKDLVSIINVFSAKLNGMRKYKTK